MYIWTKNSVGLGLGLGLLPKTSKAGIKYICLAVDAHIKYLWYAATVAPDEISTAFFMFNEKVCKVGPIEKIMSDQVPILRVTSSNICVLI